MWNHWKVLTGITRPSSLIFHPSKRYLYAINEISNFAGPNTVGSATSMAVDSATGDLRIMNVVSSGGAGPAHVGIDPEGRWLFAANYGGGSVAVLPILADGSLGPAADVQMLTGPLGPQPAWDAPPGSFAISGHDRTHAHQAEMDPAGNFLFVPDLGTDRIFIFALDKQSGKLTPGSQPFLQASPGAGPRHISFHPNRRWCYAINEEASTMLLMDYNESQGTLQIRQSVSTLPEGYAGTNYTSEIHVSSDGRFVYGLNRLHDSLVVFEINPDGWMIRVGETLTQGDYPRHFDFEPNGNFCYVLNQRSDHVAIFRLDRMTGMVQFTNQFVPVGNPSKIVFLTL